MKILIANNFYYNRGGDCTYMFALKKTLEEKGHKVVVFSMNHPRNFESPFSKYFVSYVDYAEISKKKNLLAGLNVLIRSIYSREAKKNIERLIDKERPDVAHLNNIRHHLTTSILRPLKKHNIPVVWTLHDYQLICPNISFLAGGEVCERCKKRKYYWPALKKCKKNSFLASAMAAIEHSIQMFSGVYNLVDTFICPSIFLRNKFIEYGFNEKRLVHLNYLMDIPSVNDHSNIGDYCLYIGRISEEKGIQTLIDAVLSVKSVSLKVAGEGPLKEEMVLYAKSKDAVDRINFLGHKNSDEITHLLQNCRFVVVPSEWYENFPYAVLEAFSCAKAVIGSRIGGIPELVKDKKTGFTFRPGDSVDLREKIKYLYGNPDKSAEMGKKGRLYVLQELSPAIHYDKLIDIYNRAKTNK